MAAGLISGQAPSLSSAMLCQASCLRSCVILLFGGGSYWSLFPLRGLVSDNWAQLPLMAKITDYLWHITLPITALVVSSFAGLTMLTKNSFIDEIGKQYVMTGTRQGLLTERQVLVKHVFRNAMLIVIAGFPGALIRISVYRRAADRNYLFARRAWAPWV